MAGSNDVILTGFRHRLDFQKRMEMLATQPPAEDATPMSTSVFLEAFLLRVSYLTLVYFARYLASRALNEHVIPNTLRTRGLQPLAYRLAATGISGHDSCTPR